VYRDFIHLTSKLNVLFGINIPYMGTVELITLVIYCHSKQLFQCLMLHCLDRRVTVVAVENLTGDGPVLCILEPQNNLV